MKIYYFNLTSLMSQPSPVSSGFNICFVITILATFLEVKTVHTLTYSHITFFFLDKLEELLFLTSKNLLENNIFKSAHSDEPTRMEPVVCTEKNKGCFCINKLRNNCCKFTKMYF